MEYLVRVGQLVSRSSNLVLRESDGEDDGRQAEEDHRHEAHPLGVRGEVAAAGPGRHRDQEERGCTRQPIRAQYREDGPILAHL